MQHGSRPEAIAQVVLSSDGGMTHKKVKTSLIQDSSIQKYLESATMTTKNMRKQDTGEEMPLTTELQRNLTKQFQKHSMDLMEEKQELMQKIEGGWVEKKL